MTKDATQIGPSAQSPDRGAPAVAALRQATKRFPGIVALDRVSLEFMPARFTYCWERTARANPRW
jgi:hypothetical protein